MMSRFFSSPEKAKMAARYSLKRTGTVEDFANIAEFLLTEKSSWITGQVISVDGGMSAIN